MWVDLMWEDNIILIMDSYFGQKQQFKVKMP